MSYSLIIGEARAEFPSEDNEWQFGWAVESVSRPDAPVWDCDPDECGIRDISGKTNGRHPSSMQMIEFCLQTGLMGLFFEDDYSLVRQYPGIAPLMPAHLEGLTAARRKWEAAHPDAVPGWNEGCDPVLARLIWYEWWVKWALENCSNPAIENY